MQLLKAVLIAAIVALSAVLHAQSYKVDPQKSSLGWIGEKVTGEHHGTIQLKEGEFAVHDEKMAGSFVIDMTTIKNLDLPDEGQYNKAKLEGHLKSDDFFAVASHPTAVFKITKVVPYKPREDEKANYKVTGDLTIKGITNEIAFPAYIEYDDSRFTALANFSVDRSRWDVRYGSGSFFDNLGDKLIYDDFYLELNIAGDRKQLGTN